MKEQSAKPNVIFVLGGPGSGKGTQCALILQKYHYANFVHLSTGSLLRQASTDNTPTNKQIQKIMKQGKMVPSKPLVQLIKDKVQKLGPGKVYILDGFPRNKQNIEAWNEVIGQQFNVRFLLYFECEEKQLRKRLLKRAQTSGRADDNPQTIEKRLKTFYEQTKPMLTFFKKSGGLLININGIQEIRKVQRNVCIQLKKNKLI